MLLILILVGLVLSGVAGFRHEPQTAEAAFLSEVRKLLASDAQPDDHFGRSVAVSGDTAVVGAVLEDPIFNMIPLVSAGSAYVFQRNQGGADNWGEVTKLTASDVQTFDHFGHSVAISGDIVVVGAWLESAEGLRAGAAYVFGRDQGGADNWGEVAKLTASDAQADDFFGSAVSVSGDTTVIGAYFEDTEGSNAGAAYIFKQDHGGASNWGEVKKLTASDAQAGDLFATGVAISGDTALVGAIYEDTEAPDAGAAYVFQRNQGGVDNWGETAKITASDAEAGDEFGSSVALSSNSAAVGARYESAGGSKAGAAYVFQRDQGGAENWGEVTKLTASDAAADDFFGYAIAISEDGAVVGAHGDDAGGILAGAAYVFQRDKDGVDNWGEMSKLTASDAQAIDGFGRAVALSGDTAIVGAVWHDAAADLAGAAYILDLQQTKPTPKPTPTEQPLVVGGLVQDDDSALRPLKSPESPRRIYGVLVWAISAGAGVVALGSAAWWARRRVAR